MKKVFALILTVIIVKSIVAQTIPIIDSIPMRDGKKLACDIFLPDTSGGKHYSAILIQTPYNRIFYRYALPLGIGTISNSNYAIITIDWRGFHGSASAWTLQSDKGMDGYDCVEWIAQQSWSDGKIGTWGASALGRIQYETAKENPPHLTCIVPLVAGSQYEYREYYEGGVLRTEYVQQLDSLGFGLGPVVRAHQIQDYFWNYSDTAFMYPEKIRIPVFMIGGWYDHNIPAMFELFDSLRLYSPLNVRNKHKMLFGPWAHGGFGFTHVGTLQQGQLQYPEAAGWSDSLALRFFDYYLRNINNGWDTMPNIKFFQMGENTWNNIANWPPLGTTMYKLYFSNGTLTTQIPESASDSCIFQYDPRNPSPTVGGATLDDDLEQGPYDQSPIVESRNDILIFSTTTLAENVIMRGKPTIHLFVTSNRKDTDFSIRLTDVYPDNRSMLLYDGIKRLRFRDGYKASDTSAIIPGNIYSLTINLPEIANTFLAGHKIRVDITSSNYSRFDCNLNNGGIMYTAGDTL
ncbi:MAG: CocE/NonD family hydrolase, partial [Bacteroidetes bacterium]|nr:CocE/NonD family hydrolase [Bacteroidota bacterium]